MDGIKVTIEKKKTEDKQIYPCYKISQSGTVAYFIEPHTGMIICDDGKFYAGFVCLDERYFHPFHGTINIEVD